MGYYLHMDKKRIHLSLSVELEAELQRLARAEDSNLTAYIRGLCYAKLRAEKEIAALRHREAKVLKP